MWYDNVLGLYPEKMYIHIGHLHVHLHLHLTKKYFSELMVYQRVWKHCLVVYVCAVSVRESCCYMWSAGSHDRITNNELHTEAALAHPWGTCFSIMVTQGVPQGSVSGPSCFSHFHYFVLNEAGFLHICINRIFF